MWRQKFKSSYRHDSDLVTLVNKGCFCAQDSQLINRPLSEPEGSSLRNTFSTMMELWLSCLWLCLVFFSHSSSPRQIFFPSDKVGKTSTKRRGNGAAWAPLCTGWHGSPTEFLSPRSSTDIFFETNSLSPQTDNTSASQCRLTTINTPTQQIYRLLQIKYSYFQVFGGLQTGPSWPQSVSSQNICQSSAKATSVTAKSKHGRICMIKPGR